MENFAGPDRTTTTHVNFFPYRAARGGVPLTTPAGFGTMALYNNANSQFNLLVREWAWQPGSTSGWGFGYVNQRLTGTPGVVQPFIAGEAPPFGLVDYSSQASALPTDWSFGITTQNSGVMWQTEVPFAMIRPGWSLFIQHAVIAIAVAGGFIWEAINTVEV